MNQPKQLTCLLLAMPLVMGAGERAAAQYAAAVISYDAGATPAAGFTTASAALGAPERFTGEGVFPGVVSPFSPPFLASEIVSVGEGGQITLRLSHYAIPQPVGPEIGLFENIGLIDVDFPNGQAGSPAATFGPLDNAQVDVSADGINWVSLGRVTFDVPTNGYTDLTDPFSSTPGAAPSDFQQPFTLELSSFDGLPYFDAGGPDMLELLAGSGGGTWLDISSTGLANVGYLRFSLADDGNAGTSLNFELDAVSIAHAALGSMVPEPATATLAFSAVMALFTFCLRPGCPAAPTQAQARPKRRSLEAIAAALQSASKAVRPLPAEAKPHAAQTNKMSPPTTWQTPATPPAESANAALATRKVHTQRRPPRC
jgi:hypothetical protein